MIQAIALTTLVVVTIIAMSVITTVRAVEAIRTAEKRLRNDLILMSCRCFACACLMEFMLKMCFDHITEFEIYGR